MPTQQTAVNVAVNDTLRITDHNTLVADVAELFAIVIPATATPTFSGRKLTQIVWGGNKLVITWAATLGRITTVQYYGDPTLTLFATYTPTYTGRAVSVWTKT